MSEVKEGAVSTYADLERAYREAEEAKPEPALLQISYVPVDSDLIRGVHYVPNLELLLVVFKTNNHAYCYSKVPPQIYQGLMEAESKGKYFYANIKGKFEYENLGELKESVQDA